MSENTKCNRCNGSGDFLLDEKLVKCCRCLGKGEMTLCDENRYNEFKQKWKMENLHEPELLEIQFLEYELYRQYPELKSE